MNILYINHYAGSLEMGMEFRTFYFAKELNKRGYNVTIIASDFSHLRKTNPLIKHSLEETFEENVRFTWIKSGKYHGNGVSRAISMFRFVFQLIRNAKKIALKYKPDIVVCSSTYPLDTYAGQKIAKYANAKLIHEIHDMWPSTLYEIGGMSKKHPFVRIMELAENSYIKNSDSVISMLPFTKEYLVDKGLDSKDWYYLPNGVNLNDWKYPEPLPENILNSIKKIKYDYEYVVGYFGGHAISNALDIYIDAIKKSNLTSTAFIFVGDGMEKSSLIQKTKDFNLTNVYFFESISKKSIPNLLKLFDAIYIGGMNSPLYRFGGGLNKMFDALFSSKPILLAMDLPGNPVKEVFGEKFILPNPNPQDIASLLNKLSKEKYSLSLEESEKAKQEILDKYEYSNLVDKIENIFLITLGNV